MFIDNALKDSILKSDKMEFITYYLVKYRNLLHNMKDVFIKKVIDIAGTEDKVNPRLIYGLYYEPNDVSETEFDIISAYLERILTKPEVFKDETSPKMAVCILMINKDILKNNPGLFEFHLYKKFLSQIMDLYIPCEYPQETVDTFAELIKLSDIAERPLDFNVVIERVKTGSVPIPEDVNIDDFLKLYQIISDIMMNKQMALKTFLDWFYVLYRGVYSSNEVIHTLCDRYTKYFGESTVVVISGLITDFMSGMLDASLNHSIIEYVMGIHHEIDLDSNNRSTILRCLMNDVLELVNDKIDAHRYTMIQETIKNFWLNEFPKLMKEYKQLKEDSNTPKENPDKPATESKSFLFENGLNIAIEAYKKDSAVINKSEVAVYNAYKKYKNAEDKIDSQISKAVDGMKNVLIGDVKTEIIEGKKFSAIGLLKKVLGTVGLFAAAPIKALCFLVVRYALKKNTTVSERRKIIMELEAEIEIINEKIDDAKSDGAREAKYAMMRTRTELQNALARIKYGLEADEKSIATAKKAINTNRYK